MKKTSVTINCDTCNKDISPKVSGYPHEWILKVQAIDVAMHREGMVMYSVMIQPWINEDLYFCNLACMKGF